MNDAASSGRSIAFIGGGNMASAIIGGLVAGGRAPHEILVVEPDAAQRQRLTQRFGVEPVAQAGPALASVGTVVWAVKPQSFAEAAAACAGRAAQALQVSVMAGVRCDAIARASAGAGAGAGADADAGARSARVVRAMPNTPALIGRGIAGLYATAGVEPAERARVETLFAPTGRTLWVAHEDDLDAVTALSASGPAYVFYLIEAMVEAGTAMGLPAAQSRLLAEATFEGAAALSSGSPLTPAELRAQVTSKGGTTHAAITSLDADGVKAAFMRALHAARDRAAELGRAG